MPIKVYYIDDEAFLGELFVELFESDSIYVSVFTDANKAIEASRLNPPDLCFIDFHLGGTTGINVAKQIDPKIPKFLMTSDLSITQSDLFLKIYEKPFNTQIIATDLRNFLNSKHVNEPLPTGNDQNLNGKHLFIDHFHKIISKLEESAIIAITDANGIINYANDNFQKLSGYSSQELIGRTHALLKSGEHSPDFYSEMWKTLLAGKVWRGTLKNLNKSGAFYWVDTTIIPISDEKDETLGYLSIRNDLSPLFREKGVIDRLMEQDRIIESIPFLVHEMNNSLAVSIASVDRIQRLVGIKDPTVDNIALTKKSLNLVLDSHRHLSKIIKSLSSSARSGVEPLSTGASLSFEEIQRELRNWIDRLSENSQITFIWEFVEGTSHNCENMPALKSVLYFLIKNSIEALSPLEEKWIRVRILQIENHLAITVTDSGKGIDKSIQNSIWTPFFTTKNNSLGLGLSTAKNCLARIGGSLHYSSSSENTEFMFTIPIGAQSDLSKKKLKFLILEDSRVFGELLKTEVEDEGHQAVWHTNLTDAYAELELNTFDFMFCDLHLEGKSHSSSGSGLEFIKYVRKHVSKEVVIFVTTGLELIDRNAVLRCGADFFEYKPITRGVRSIIREMIDLSQLRKSKKPEMSKHSHKPNSV